MHSFAMRVKVKRVEIQMVAWYQYTIEEGPYYLPGQLPWPK